MHMHVQRRVIRRLALGAVLVSMAVAHNPASAVTIDWVTVGDPGNEADSTAYGDVADSFRIMKFEWTNAQYVDFLNAVDPNGTNPNSIYNSGMSNGRGGISFASFNPAGSKYAARTNMGDKPVNFVSWFDAARVANWLHNGQGTGSTETGAYTLGGATTGNAVAKNPGATFYIPTENEWYKAAYYKGSGTNAGYWDYATRSDTAPTAVTSGSTGIGSAGSTGNFANFNTVADWNSQNGNVTTVGTNGGPSAYGTFDMSGNVFEWNDLTGSAGSSRGYRGGNWGAGANFLWSFGRVTNVPSTASNLIGFRLAAVPEPSTYCMGLAGLACGGYLVKQRRKRA